MPLRVNLNSTRMPSAANKLYYGDNLEVLRGSDANGQPNIPANSVDLIYLDPPFNSRQDYNVLFAEKDGSRSASQITAFKDSWEWNAEAARSYYEVVEKGGSVSEALQSFRTMLRGSDMLAYLVMMAGRLIELKRVLKDTGSIYLHCDPTASHYLKLLMDGVFGPQMFRTEIIWKRSSAHSDAKQGRKQHGRIHDVILFYTNSDNWKWNQIYTEYDSEYLNKFYRHVEEDTGRKFRRDNLTAARPGGDTKYEWRVKKHLGVRERWLADLDDEFQQPREGWEYKSVLPYTGRYWAYSKANMKQFAMEGRLLHTFDGRPEFKRFLDEMPGVPLQDVWTDIPPIGAQAQERLGYPTQKPEALLERILQSSSNEGDLVLDPFCGCGTTIQVAQKLNRRWIGIDITHLAIGLIKTRLDDSFGSEVRQTYQVIGEPTDVAGAAQLAAENKFQFQYWALGLCGARPAEGVKKGADRGIDGRLYFHDDNSGKSKQIIFSVKGGQNTHVSEVRDLIGVLDREKAEIGVYISIAEPTRAMQKEAAEAGFYTSADGSRYPRLQLLTIEGLMKGMEHLERPRHVRDVTFKAAPRHREAPAANLSLNLTADE
ncbi:MAG: restriction endonuclease [Acidobacteriaceae bacterium]|nr:restriction endonuclease [Acidobacteriaceae bacterium]